MKKIKDNLASLIYRIILIVVKLIPCGAKSNHLMVIKTDEIGDFMLFRSLFKYIKQSEKYSNYRVVLVGNDAWRTIFEEYDMNTVDEIIWVAKKRFKRDLKYRFSILKQARMFGATEVINCIFSRGMSLDDGFAFVATGNNKYAMKGNNANRGDIGINFDMWIYKKVIDAGDEKLFESIRNRNFLQELLAMKLPAKTSLTLTNKYKQPAKDYLIVFIGAGNKPERKWPIEYFIECAEYIAAKYHLMPVVCGSPPDEADGQVFIEKFKGEAINLVSKTTLPEFIELTGKAKMLLSVDTGPVHMAAAAGCPVVALYSGVFYGRYAPYPADVAQPYYSIYPDFIDELVKENNPILYGEFTLKNESIRSIPVSKVLPYIDKTLGLSKS